MALLHKKNLHQQTKKKSKKLVFQKKKNLSRSNLKSTLSVKVQRTTTLASLLALKITLLRRYFLSPLACQFSTTTWRVSLHPLLARRFPASSAEPQRRDLPRVPPASLPLSNPTKAQTEPRDPAAKNPCWNITASVPTPLRLFFQTSSSSGSIFQRQRLGNTLSLHLQPICWSNTWEGAFAHSAVHSRRGNSCPATMPADPFGHGELLII